MEKGYDLEEARDLIARKNDALDPDIAARINASGELLRELASLGGTTGVRVVEEQRGKGFWVYCGEEDATLVSVTPKGTIWASPGGGPGQAVPGLEFNPIEGIWEGTDPDIFNPAKPGERQKKRSAVAVVIDYAMSLGDIRRGQERLAEQVRNATRR
jgi:hypothetical protein